MQVFKLAHSGGKLHDLEAYEGNITTRFYVTARPREQQPDGTMVPRSEGQVQSRLTFTARHKANKWGFDIGETSVSVTQGLLMAQEVQSTGSALDT